MFFCSNYGFLQEVTLADLFHIPYGSSLPLTGVDPLDNKNRPNVARFVVLFYNFKFKILNFFQWLRWWKDISSRPSWEAVKDGVTSTA